MAARNICLLQVRLSSRLILSHQYHTSNIHNAKAPKFAKAGGKMGQPVVKVVLDVESDPQKLVTRCCGANIYVDGEDPVLKPDSEYPDWLWNLRTEHSSPELSELEEDSFAYWRRLRKLNLQRKNLLSKVNRIKR